MAAHRSLFGNSHPGAAARIILESDPRFRAEASAPGRRAGHLTCRRSKASPPSHPAPSRHASRPAGISRMSPFACTRSFSSSARRSTGSSLLSRRRAQPAGRYSWVPISNRPPASAGLLAVPGLGCRDTLGALACTATAFEAFFNACRASPLPFAHRKRLPKITKIAGRTDVWR